MPAARKQEAICASFIVRHEGRGYGRIPVALASVSARSVMPLVLRAQRSGGCSGASWRSGGCGYRVDSFCLQGGGGVGSGLPAGWGGPSVGEGAALQPAQGVGAWLAGSLAATPGRRPAGDSA